MRPISNLIILFVVSTFLPASSRGEGTGSTPPGRTSSEPVRELTLWYTTNLLAELTPCG